MKKTYLDRIRSGEEFNISQMLSIILRLSLPGIMAQLSSVVMSYADASMVGRLGPQNGASIGLVSSSTWLFGGLCVAFAAGFNVLVAQRVGAGDYKGARNLMKLGLLCGFLWSTLLMIIGVSICKSLPVMLGGSPDIVGGSTAYFRIYSLFLPIMQLSFISSGMLQSTGNMKLPSIVQISKCFLNVFFNGLFIFPSRVIQGVNVPGLGLGVAGASLGTGTAELVSCIVLLSYLLLKSDLALQKGESFSPDKKELIESIKISGPVAAENFIMNSAQVTYSGIISVLGSIALSANSFAVTVEAICYMPAYGIGHAASALVGQCIGAKRFPLAEKMGRTIALFGTVVMTLSGIALYIMAPYMMGFISTDPEVAALGTQILRIEAVAEPLYGASIAIGGVFRGAGKTLRACIINLVSMWCFRIPLAIFLVPRMGLHGAWTAMRTELMLRGLIYLVILFKNGVTGRRKKD